MALIGGILGLLIPGEYLFVPASVGFIAPGVYDGADHRAWIDAATICQTNAESIE